LCNKAAATSFVIDKKRDKTALIHCHQISKLEQTKSSLIIEDEEEKKKLIKMFSTNIFMIKIIV
jgi:hypothetical protein